MRRIKIFFVCLGHRYLQALQIHLAVAIATLWMLKKTCHPYRKVHIIHLVYLRLVHPHPNQYKHLHLCKCHQVKRHGNAHRGWAARAYNLAHIWYLMISDPLQCRWNGKHRRIWMRKYQTVDTSPIVWGIFSKRLNFLEYFDWMCDIILVSRLTIFDSGHSSPCSSLHPTCNKLISAPEIFLFSQNHQKQTFENGRKNGGSFK